jgi:hypothetical protein
MFSALTRVSGPVFTFCVSRLAFGGIDGVGSRILVLRAWTRVRRYRGRRVSFSIFALPDLFSAVTRALGPVFTFCAPGLIFDGTEGVASRFLVLRARTHFRRYRGHRVPFSRFALPDSFSAVTSASIPVFTFCAPGQVFVVAEGIGSHFHVLRSRTRFRRCRGRPVPFSHFARPDSFSAVSMTSCPVF